MSRTFVGFGFGAIQAGLFLPEVQNSENFDRVVVSEIDPVLVAALRESRGEYFYQHCREVIGSGMIQVTGS